MRNIRLMVMVGVLILLGVVAAPAAAQDQFTPEYEATACPFPMPIGAVEGEDIICGMVTVPESHADPDGPTIKLAMGILKSTSDTPAPEPLVMFTGGPGGNIFNLAPPIYGSAVRADRDVVLFSERGAFGSQPFLACPELGESLIANFGADADTLNALRVQAFAACHDRLIAAGVDLNVYNNPQRAADVPLVMDALGYDAYHLWGVSGGGLMTQYALRQNPDGIQSILIDSGSFPHASFEEVWMPLIDNISDKFSLLFETCAADTACNESYPELETIFLTLVDDLNANPVMLPVTNPLTGDPVDVALTGDMVVTSLANSFAAVATLPKTIAEMADGDYSFIQVVIPTLYVTEGSDFSDGLFQSVACSEIDHLSIDDVSTANSIPQIAEAMLPAAQNSFDICDVWGVEGVPPGEVLVSDVPALIMEGVFDTNKPPELGAMVAQNFSNSQLVEFPDKAHVTFGPCAVDLMVAFMNDPAADLPTGCMAEAVTFALPGTALSFSPVTLEGIGVTTVAPDGWQQIDEGTWLRGASASDETLLLMLALPGDDVEAVVTALAAGEGFDTPAVIDTFDLDGRTWSIYFAAQGENLAAIAGTTQDGTVYLNVLAASASDIESLAEPVLLPILQAFEIDG